MLPPCRFTNIISKSVTSLHTELYRILIAEVQACHLPVLFCSVCLLCDPALWYYCCLTRLDRFKLAMIKEL